ncbi:hypothetical protein ACFIQF_02540 [Comamonas sp. J-3]|uniref:hypothetical protein n=1 Tax=Comamonas trifloxystrobinivorans TaxID=3350256 RepID=UPI003729E8AD
MRNALDFSSWQSLLSTLLGLLLATLLMLGIRLVFMQTLQRKRERENRQINERLKTLIAAYKTLGSSFTGELAVDPSHLKQMREQAVGEPQDWEALKTQTERRRRIRDAVEAALSDVILLGTEEQVALAAQAAQDMVAGRPVHTGALVVSLRSFIREALDLQAIPASVTIPDQGPQRVAGSGGGGSKRTNNAGGNAGGAGKGGGGAGGGMGMGGGMALSAGATASAHSASAAVASDTGLSEIESAAADLPTGMPR